MRLTPAAAEWSSSGAFPIQVGRLGELVGGSVFEVLQVRGGQAFLQSPAQLKVSVLDRLIDIG